MIKILVVDDNTLKQQKINEVICSVEGVINENIFVASDIISAKRELLEQTFDLLLLDIQIPNRFNEKPKQNGGIQFLKELMVSKRYKLPLNIIGITAHEEIFESAKNIFDDQLLWLIKFESNSDNWSKSLKKRIEHLINTKKLDNIKTTLEFDYDIAVICALDKIELEGLKRVADNWQHINMPSDENTNYYSCNFNDGVKSIKIIAAAASQMGMTASAVLSMKLVQLFRPKYLVMIGIAAGIRGKVNLGDILVSDQSWDYGSGKYVTEDGRKVFQPDPYPIRLRPSLKSKIQLLSSNTQILEEIRSSWNGDSAPSTILSVHIGPVSTGAAVLSNTEMVKDILLQNRKLIGIDMENYSVYFTAENCPKPQPQVFSLKSVCDYADEEKADQYQKYAAYTSAAVLKILSLNFLDFDEK